MSGGNVRWQGAQRAQASLPQPAHPAVPGTDLGFPVPVSVEVWQKNVSPLLPMQGELMAMLLHDTGAEPFFPGAKPSVAPRRYQTEHVVGFDLGTYPGTAYRSALLRDRDDSGSCLMQFERIFLNPKELPA